MDEQLLCRLEDLPDGGSRGLLPDGFDDRLLAVRQGGEVFVWLNDCPHEHRPLGWKRHEFLSGDASHIVCYAHSAHFDIRSGRCFAGPCTGEHLRPVPTTVHDGAVWLSGPLPKPFDQAFD
ncbi:Rieske (2Fe-2S) protein [Aquabacterium sp.]|uniref:Rieske (2Fe-2S) protein n=1 Tax=Aquabacterium sp. TaxID=1872578 RepID=UPI002D125C2C|nr:Rieske (2Fe-2S) protein [Aquabacterium sp.]HSW04367.1 Rieske (2Fe-2S) protein [Aquabacterium sp.]